ncbi:MAG: DUF1232 domain-containing protein [Verrucomicrobiae bacterium]|nr:DUF1232 domain-containing protein [Verrucomicrobiae bacterium]
MEPDTTTHFTEDDLNVFIANGASRLTPREVQDMVSELPDLREQFARFRETPFAATEQKLHFLAHVVEHVWTDKYRDMPYGAALEAAFAITYFTRETDLIPDTLGTIGLLDDSAIIEAVLVRNERAYALYRAETKRD